MADIYLARQFGIAAFERLVVVKKILPRLAEESEFVQMFLDEARHAALINHPNVVQVYDVGVEGGEYFIAMELVAGVTLSAMNRAARRQGTPLSSAAALEITAQACDGLDAAHGQADLNGVPLGLVHRDVTPQNVMVTHRGIVKLLDFGIAKASQGGNLTQAGRLKGKYAYMSPEQARSEPLDGRSDLFSLGTVLYELLTGRNPFEGASVVETLQNIALLEPSPPSEVQRDVPPEVDALVMKALARDRDNRFQTARELGRRARELLAQMGRPSSMDILGAELSARFDGLLAAQRNAVDEAVSIARTGSGRTPSGRDKTAGLAEAETRVAPEGTAAAAERVRHRRLARGSGVAALVLTLVGALVLVLGPERDDSRAGNRPRPAATTKHAPRPVPPRTIGTVASPPPTPATGSAGEPDAGPRTEPRSATPPPRSRGPVARAAEMVEVEVSSEPPGASVSAGRMTYGVTPIGIFLPQGRSSRVTVRLPGYDASTVSWSSATSPRRLHVRLRPTPP